ncbi:hypothetical protein CROQUDRAFT_668125 [Cronartium quercuum f. sp. fusiforme G11]|uniref:Xylulose kinase n=1 Tax=Cronartium quercuum f. sp. fusiforme G11 TaxID=708437 RepID=A0A9P6NWX4_9BASI|nr:hypothetical protein CROQUDRAFT_668125 [Cronartium quercuum f. sp. fusiforme G11]
MSEHSSYMSGTHQSSGQSGSDQNPPPGSSGSQSSYHRPYFLSFDLSTEKLRVQIVDDLLDLILADEIWFDVGLPEYGTQQGCHVEGEVSTSPTHMHVKAVDILLERIASRIDLKQVKCISGSAQHHASVWWSKAAGALLSRVTPQKRLHEQLPPEQTWTMPNAPNFYDMSTITQAQSLEWMIGGAHEMARKTGGRAFCRFTGVQIMKVQQTRRNILEATERISLASSFLATLFLGSFSPLNEADAAGTNLWNVAERRWDHHLLSLVMGTDPTNPESYQEASKLKKKLGDPQLDGSIPIGPISSYFVRRYGFAPDCQVATFIGHHLATFLSHRLGPQDALVCLGDSDTDSVILPVQSYMPDPARQILPHPASAGPNAPGDVSGLAILEYKDADLARCFVRDAYCNASWQIFDALVALIAEGGRIGFFWPQGELGAWQGISRFECGQRTDEFRDIRANPRSLLESQFMTMRMQLARIYQAARQSKNLKPKACVPYNSLGFDPYDHSILPRRLIVMGRASDSRVMIDMLSSILGAPVFQSTSLAPMTYSPRFSGPESAVSPAGLGAAYKAAWTHARRLGSADSYSAFLSERFQQRAERLRGAHFDRGPSHPIITTSIASFEAPEPSVSPTSPFTPRRMSFSTVKIAPGLGLTRPGSPPIPTCGSILVVPIHTDPDDAEVGLIKVAEPDEDLFQQYGGQVEEFARLESFVSKGML